MAGFLGFLKTIFVPALVSLIVYLLLTHLILPFVRRHRHRYNQYLPVQGGMDTISSGTSSLRHRATDALYTFLVPSRWQRRHRVVDGSYASENNEDELFDDEEGEGMVGFDIDERRREALERRRSGVGEEDRRLSRDLEEGFKDDSDDEEEAVSRHPR